MKLRFLLMTIFLVLLIAASFAGQSAVSHSKQGQEDLTFWTHRRGLEQIDVDGEVGFGDLARVLLRRRDNAALLLDQRDRFTFRTVDPARLETPDAFRARITSASRWEWTNLPPRVVATAGRITNLPVILDNQTQSAVETSLGTVPAGKATGYLLRLQGNDKPGSSYPRTLRIEQGGRTHEARYTVDVRAPGKLRVRIQDSDGKPAASARVMLTASDGLSYVPAGSVPRIAAMSAEYFFHAPVGGTFTIDLPAGPARIEATRGIEYELTSQLVDIPAGGTAEALVHLRRWSEMSQQGWWAADSHIHANYTADHHQVMTPEDVRVMALGEDLHVPNLLVANSGGAFIHDRAHFTGKPHALSDPKHILYWNEEFRNGGLYGHMAFFGLTRLIEPFYTGFRNTPYPDDYPPNYTAAAEARKQGAAALYVHPGMSAGLDQLDWGASAKELPVDAALGVIDAMDVLSNNDEMAGMELWYRLLNCGLKIAISAGTDSFFNVTDHYVPGGHRVFVKSGATLSYRDWVDGYRRGRSFATNGPVVTLLVNGREPGDEIRVEPGAKVRVEARFKTNVPVDRFDVMQNGVAVLSKRGIDRGEVMLQGEVAMTDSGWIAARALGPRHRLVLNDTAVFAHTSPVHVRVGEQPVRSAEDARFFIEWIARLRAMIERRGKFSRPEQKAEVMALQAKAEGVYRAMLQ